MAKKEKAVEWMYNIVQYPHITEKATMGSENSQVTFKVPMDATKPRIKSAIETLFNVKVKGVNTMIQKGKNKRFKGIPIRKPDFKKAVVTLEAGQTIDTGTGV
jgi:large subunit ribosomal protein L23